MPNPPESLEAMQEAFSLMARTPVDFSTGKFVFQHSLYPRKLKTKVVSNEIASGSQRLEVYNQQYWYRLFTLLQDIYPTLAGELGLWRLNQLSSDYLTMYPSEYYTLDNLVDKLYGFILSSSKWNSTKLLQIVDLETWYEKAFRKETYPELNVTEFENVALESLLDSCLQFQPSFKLYREDWNFVESLFSAQGGEGVLNFKESVKFWALQRIGKKISTLELSETKFNLLQSLYTGESLNTACENLFSSLNEEGQTDLFQNLSHWFYQWSRQGFFVSVVQSE